MHNTKVLQYFRLFAKHFNMEKYIRFNTEVTSVSRMEDFKQTGKWNLDVCDKATGKTTKETYDAVLICTGHHAEKNVPYFLGQADFKGQIIHTHDFRNHKGFEGKRVVVVGIGNAGADAAVDLSRIASQVGNRLSRSMIYTVSDMLHKSQYPFQLYCHQRFSAEIFHICCVGQVYLSTRRGAWVIHRVGPGGTPIDMVNNARVSEFFRGILPRNMYNSFMESFLNRRFDHKQFGLKPENRFDGQHAPNGQ